MSCRCVTPQLWSVLQRNLTMTLRSELLKTMQAPQTPFELLERLADFRSWVLSDEPKLTSQLWINTCTVPSCATSSYSCWTSAPSYPCSLPSWCWGSRRPTTSKHRHPRRAGLQGRPRPCGHTTTTHQRPFKAFGLTTGPLVQNCGFQFTQSAFSSILNWTSEVISNERKATSSPISIKWVSTQGKFLISITSPDDL